MTDQEQTATPAGPQISVATACIRDAARHLGHVRDAGYKPREAAVAITDLEKVLAWMAAYLPKPARAPEK